MKKVLRVFSVLLTVALIGGLGAAVIYRQQVLDYIALRDYSPSERVVSLANATTMNDAARKVFYVNHPELQDKSTFSSSCALAEQTIVLGCYISNKGVYLLDVSDPRLSGIIEVTAAHETLHAEYDRLSAAEKNKIDKMTIDFFAGLKNDRIRQNIENYRKRDPLVVPNELHSILATEVRDLSPELETYYGQYFKDRKSIVALSEKYEKTFTDIENQVKAYDVRLKSMKVEIDGIDSSLGGLEKEVTARKEALDRSLKANRVSEYNGGVDSFNVLVNRYNGLVTERQNLTKEYNVVVEEYNKLASTEAQLLDSLKSSPAPISTEVKN